jgi:nuclease S1
MTYQAGARQKWIWYLALMCFLIWAMPVRAFAWGNAGHRIIAQIAQDNLTAKARKEVSKLLPSSSMVSDSTWADIQRVTNPKTRRWHFVDIPLNADSYDPNASYADSDCIVAKIDYFTKVLSGRSSSADRTEALRFLIHLVGDIHDPMHCVDNNDAGGNKVKLTFFGDSTNLHSVWDSGIIERSIKGKESYYAKSLESKFEGQKSALLKGGTPQDWAWESHAVAVYSAYSLPPGKVLSEYYFQTNAPVVDAQLFAAGIRLAALLNQILDSKGDK